MRDAGAPPSRRALALATVAAIGVALVALVLFVLPAEYGIDPTGMGAAMGLTILEGGPGTDTDPATDIPVNTTGTTIQTYTSSFPLTSTQAFSQEGYLTEGETTIVAFQLDQVNISKVTMRLEFQDTNTTPNGGGTRPDTFEIELKAPNGDVSGGVLSRSDATSGGGLGKVDFTVRPPPYPRDIESTTLDDARRAFERNDPPDTTLTGGWKARISMIDAGDGDAQGVPLATGPVADTGNEWKITVSVQTYALEVAEKPGTRQRADKVTLTIPAGGELEYKLAMAFGKRLDYDWRTNGPAIYVDFHGEKTRDASGAFTRHNSGDLAADAGTLIAPFDGRHGWFWRNTHGQPVTITLETRGQYEVIGRV